MAIKTDELAAILKERIANFKDTLSRSETGLVVKAGDGIARVYGLNDCMYGELVEFDGGSIGMAMNLETDDVGCILFSGENAIAEGQTVRRTGKVVEVPAGPALLGRIVDPLGKPIDGLGSIECKMMMKAERTAPSVIDRKGVSVPLHTGILAIDSMVPIGRGQRELIIGDRQTGKTTIAVDTIISQKNRDVICIYVAIGQKASTTAQVVENLRKYGALDYTIIVASTARDPAAMQYLAPYSGSAIAEYFMEQEKKDVLIVYDDLSKHAVAYRALSLLLRRPPGREAFPGDVFYLHSRLLERSARLSDKLGGGSITALPIIETQGGDISSYIPTNVISITDGQIFLESDLFFAGIRPPVNVGLSVSRVGGSAQTKAMRKVAGRLRIDLAQYRELAAFSQFGSDLDKATQERLNHGALLVEAMKQGQFCPYNLADEIIILYATVNGMLSVKVDELGKTLKALISFIRYKNQELIDTIEKTCKLEPETEDTLKNLITEYSSHMRSH